MPRPKGLRMTKQIRAYEDTADFIAELVNRKPTGTTFADVLDEAMRRAYPDLYDKVIQAKSQARSLIDEALGEPKE